MNGIRSCIVDIGKNYWFRERVENEWNKLTSSVVDGYATTVKMDVREPHEGKGKR